MFYATAAVGEVTHCQTAREVQNNANGREATLRSDPQYHGYKYYQNQTVEQEKVRHNVARTPW